MKKKFLALTLVLVLILSALTVSASAWDQSKKDLAPTSAGKLTVTANGENPTEVKVGDYFSVFVGLKAGEAMILNAQCRVEYDSAFVSFVPVERYIKLKNSEDKSVESYCFPASIYNASPVINYEDAGNIKYNFSKAKGAGVFNDTTQLFARFCFKANAAGTTDITHVIQYMINADETRIYYKSQPNPEINPSVAVSVTKYVPIGDVNTDGNVNGADAGLLSRYTAGWDGYATRIKNMEVADINNDGKVNGADAGFLKRKAAGWTNYDKYFDTIAA